MILLCVILIYLRWLYLQTEKKNEKYGKTSTYVRYIDTKFYAISIVDFEIITQLPIYSIENFYNFFFFFIANRSRIMLKTYACATQICNAPLISFNIKCSRISYHACMHASVWYVRLFTTVFDGAQHWSAWNLLRAYRCVR